MANKKIKLTFVIVSFQDTWFLHKHSPGELDPDTLQLALPILTFGRLFHRGALILQADYPNPEQDPTDRPYH